MRPIIITDVDLHRLEALLASDVIKIAAPTSELAKLTEELHRARIVQPGEVPTDVITMNSIVVLCDMDTGERETYTLVFPHDANIAEGKLSVLAPIGTAVLGQRVGDELRWPVPAGWRRLRIEEVVFQPEREAGLPFAAAG